MHQTNNTNNIKLKQEIKYKIMQQFVQSKVPQKKKLTPENLSQIEILKDAINKIFQTKYSSLSFEELYRTAYTLVINRNGDVLYDEVKNAIAGNLQLIVSQLKPVTEPNVMLAVIKEIWGKFNTYLSVTNDILMYMDKNYVARNHLQPVPDLGYVIYKEVVLQKTGLLDRLHQAMISEITKDRNGEYVEKSSVKEVSSMLSKIGIGNTKIYEEYFEKHFLEQTKQYYSIEVQKALAELSCPDYLQNAEHRLTQEVQRCDAFVDKITGPKLKEILIEIFLRTPAKMLITMESSGLEKLIQHERIGDIDRMYRLFSQDSECKKLLLQSLIQSIKTEGERLLKEHEQDEKKDTAKFIEALISMKEKYNKIWIDACKKDKEYEVPIKQSFDTFINATNSTAKALAGYCDDLMKERVKQMSDADLERILEKIIIVFRHIQSKDMFEEFYVYHLSRRLLYKKTASDDAERSMITKLKAECGNQYTQKLETMMKDMTNSQETMRIFQEEYDMSLKPTKLEVRILTQGNWPIEGKVQVCNLPVELNDLMQEFTEFYMKRHSGRVLNWKLNMGEAEIRAHIGGSDKTYELITTTYQAAILCLFNDADELLFEDILHRSQIPEADLKKNFTSLLITKILIRVGSDNSKEIKESDKFRVNDHFVSKFNRVRLPQINDKQTVAAQEPLQTLESTVEDDRGMLIDATLVKIMKARKKVQHNELVTDCIKIVSERFKGDPVAIKARIESLIEKDYIERSKADRKIYIYKA